MFVVRVEEQAVFTLASRGAARDFGPHEKNLYRAPNTAATFFDAILHTIMHFNGIFGPPSIMGP